MHLLNYLYRGTRKWHLNTILLNNKSCNWPCKMKLIKEIRRVVEIILISFFISHFWFFSPAQINVKPMSSYHFDIVWIRLILFANNRYTADIFYSFFVLVLQIGKNDKNFGKKNQKFKLKFFCLTLKLKLWNFKSTLCWKTS